jgi:maltose phosphorylase
MAGTWISIVEGFGGMRIREDMLSFNPLIPAEWKILQLQGLYRENTLKINVTNSDVTIFNEVGDSLIFKIYGKEQKVLPNSSITIPVQKQFFCIGIKLKVLPLRCI